MEKESYRLLDKLKPDQHFENISRPVIIADNLRTPENMGLVLRLAGNIGAEKTIFISPVAHEFRKYKIKRTASGAADSANWQIVKDPGEAIRRIPPGYRLIALETAEKAHNLFDHALPEKTAFVIGNEVNGISDELLRFADEIVYIFILGNISLLNVIYAFSVALFEWFRQMRLGS